MRIIIKTSPNTEIVPFNYQKKQVGCLHKWLGENNQLHDSISLYSFSWLKNGKFTQKGFNFSNGATWFISFYDIANIKQIIDNIIKDPIMFCGLKVVEVIIQENIDLTNRNLFYVESPVLLKRYDETENRHIPVTFMDEDANSLLKQVMLKKMNLAKLPYDETFDIQFDLSYAKKKTKLVTYGKIKHIASECPIIIKGTQETKAFIWDVGVGQSTGIGMGAII